MISAIVLVVSHHIAGAAVLNRARWCAMHPEDTAMFDDFWPLMKRWTKRYLVPFPTGLSAVTVAFSPSYTSGFCESV